jgi:hypothetical protein
MLPRFRGRFVLRPANHNVTRLCPSSWAGFRITTSMMNPISMPFRMQLAGLKIHLVGDTCLAAAVFVGEAVGCHEFELLRVNMHRVIFSGIASFWLVASGTASAGQITNWQLYDGNAAPVVTLCYTGADGTGSLTSPAYADPQVSFGTTTPVYYCVDLWHENDVGQTYTINQVSGMTFINSTFVDADNRIGWLLTQDQSTIDDRAAVQLAIWYTVDNKPNASLGGFSMTSSDPTITADYNTLISFAGYDLATNYAANFWQATHDPTNSLYQDLVSVGSVPEPSSIVLSLISGLIFVGLQLWRRIG